MFRQDIPARLLGLVPGTAADKHPGAAPREHFGRVEAQAGVGAGDKDRFTRLVGDIACSETFHILTPWVCCRSRVQ